MRTLRPVRLTVLLPLALVAVACSGAKTGSGGSDDASRQAATTTTAVAQSAYARRLDALCRRALAAHAGVGSATTTEELVATLPRANAIDNRFVRAVGKLKPAKREARRAGRLLYLYTAMADIQDTAYVQLKASGSNGYFQYMSTALEVRGQAEKLARSLGAPTCAKRPVTR